MNDLKYLCTLNKTDSFNKNKLISIINNINLIIYWVESQI